MTSFESIRNGIGKAWGSVAEGWQLFYQRCKGALTYFDSQSDELSTADERRLNWGILNTDLADHQDSLIVTMEVPGLEKDDINIDIDGDILNISGTKRLQEEYQEGNYHIMERAYGFFQRRLHLASKVDREKVDASYHNGVLRLRLPKLESTKKIQIDVK